MPRGYAKKNQWGVDFIGLDAFQKKLESLGDGAVERAFDAALLATEQVVKERVTAAMQKHNQTGHTVSEVITGVKPEWTQSVAKAPVGFRIEDDLIRDDDRLASVFLMYGTKVYGQPHEAPKKEVVDAIYGVQTRQRVRQIQKKAFLKVIRRLGG